MDQELQGIVAAIKNEIGYTMIKQMEPCRTIFAQYAQNEVLDKYKPEQYIRRSGENGAGPYEGTTGVADKRSYEITVNNSDLTMTIESTVQGNPRYEGTRDGWDPGDITDIIESGKGYNWKDSKIYGWQPYPRPWMDKAGDDFVDNLLGPMIDIALTKLLGG